MEIQFEDITILTTMGQGTSSKVFKCVLKKQPQKLFALKKTKLSGSPFQRQQLLWEIETMEGMNHPNILRIFGHWEWENHLYLLLEYCDQGTLELLIEQKQLTLKEKFFIMTQMKNAYEYLHDNGIVHRDIKLANIFVKGPGLNVKLGDFGSCQDQKNFSTLVGSQLFQAPEVSLGLLQEYDYKIDLYSLGICFWLILFGMHNYPYSIENENANANDKMNKELNFPLEIKEDWKVFFSDILNPDGEERMDALLFFNHVFFNEFMEEDYESMGKFNDEDSLEFKAKQWIEEELEDSFDHLHTNWESGKELPNLQYSSVHPQLKTQLIQQDFDQSQRVQQLLTKEKHSGLQKQFLQFKAISQMEEKLLEIHIIKKVTLSLHKVFQWITSSETKTILLLWMALFDQCSKKLKYLGHPFSSKSSQNYLLKIITSNEQLSQYYLKKVENLTKSIEKLILKNHQQFQQLQMKDPSPINSLFFDKTISPFQKKDLLFKCFKAYEKQVMKTNTIQGSVVLEKLKLILKGEVIKSMDQFVFDQLN